jgi:hypothetical protein
MFWARTSSLIDENCSVSIVARRPTETLTDVAFEVFLLLIFQWPGLLFVPHLVFVHHSLYRLCGLGNLCSIYVASWLSIGCLAGCPDSLICDLYSSTFHFLTQRHPCVVFETFITLYTHVCSFAFWRLVMTRGCWSAV